MNCHTQLSDRKSANNALAHLERRDRCEAACKDIPDSALTEGAVMELVDALEWIEAFGHNGGHGRGYTCATLAESALTKFRGER